MNKKPRRPRESTRPRPSDRDGDTRSDQTAAPRGSALDPQQTHGLEDVCLVFGWTLIAIFLTFGVVLESFHLAKLPLYLDIRLRRELWTLAHAHGTLLGVLNVLFGLSAGRLLPRPDTRNVAARLLMLGGVLVPLGFFAGGIGNAEGDPSLAIALVPTGAVLAIVSLGLLVRGGWQVARHRPR